MPLPSLIFNQKTCYLQMVHGRLFVSTYLMSIKKFYPTVLLVLLATASYSQKGQEQGEAGFLKKGQWANYGNDPGGMRYSPLMQINAENVKNLKPAWTYRSGELATYEGTSLASKAAFEATPL